MERWATATLSEGDVFVSTRTKEGGGRAAKGTVGAPYLPFYACSFAPSTCVHTFQGVDG
jgi:hypothetical protein